MTIEMQPKYIEVTTTDGTAAGDDKAELYFHIFCEEDDEEPDIRAYVTANLGTGYEGLVLRSRKLKRISDTIWDLTASYTSNKDAATIIKLEPDDVIWSIRSSKLGTVKTKESLKLISEQTENDTQKFSGKKYERFVGVDYIHNQGFTTEGREVSGTAVNIEVRTVIPAAQVTAGYLITAAQWAAQEATNLNAWEGFAAGTLRLIDYQANQQGAEDGDDPNWDVSFTLEFQPNIMIPAITGNARFPELAKRGHEMFDPNYKAFVDDDGKKKQKLFRRAVHQVYPEIDFATVLRL